MAIIVVDEPDVYVTRSELERLRQEYALAFTHYTGIPPSFEEWVRQRKSPYNTAPSNGIGG